MRININEKRRNLSSFLKITAIVFQFFFFNIHWLVFGWLFIIVIPYTHMLHKRVQCFNLLCTCLCCVLYQESSQHSFTQLPNHWCQPVFQETQENVGGGEVASVKLAYCTPLLVYISCTVDRSEQICCW